MQQNPNPTDMVASRQAWEEESVALRLYTLDPQDVWYVESLCGHCEMLFLTDETEDDCDSSERIVVYKTHLIGFSPTDSEKARGSQGH